jgi:hypothetical protein
MRTTMAILAAGILASGCSMIGQQLGLPTGTIGLTGEDIIALAEQYLSGDLASVSTPASNPTPVEVAEPVEAVTLRWTCGGIDGSGATPDGNVTITKSRLTTSLWTYTQTAPESAGWPKQGEKNGKTINTIVCLFFERGTVGTYEGGKFDWGYGGTDPLPRPTSEHIQGANPYKGHKPYAKGTKYAACLLDKDGKRRSGNVWVGVVE